MKVWKPDNKSALIKHWTEGVEFEARTQVQNIAALPFIYPHIAVMPDVHMGKGATVGSVIPTRGAVIPSAVGVDIGCGMQAVRLPLKASGLPDNLGPSGLPSKQTLKALSEQVADLETRTSEARGVLRRLEHKLMGYGVN